MAEHAQQGPIGHSGLLALRRLLPDGSVADDHGGPIAEL